MTTLLGMEIQLPEQVNFLAGPVFTFAINLFAWLILAVIMYWVFIPIIKIITRYLPSEVEEIIIGIIRKPISILIFVIGIRVSLTYLVPDQTLTKFLARFTMTLIIIILGHITGRILRDVVVYYGEKWARKTESQVDDILIPVISLFGPLLLVTIAALIILPMWGVNISSVLLGAGVLGLVLGLALQETLSNIFSGLSLLIEAPFRQGDLIRLTSGKICEVERMGLRSTRLLSLDEQATIYMPNKLLATDFLTNLTKPTAEQRYSISVKVNSGHDLNQINKILYSVAAGHPGVVGADIQAKIPDIRAMVERVRQRAALLPPGEERAAIEGLANKNEYAIERLSLEGEVNTQLDLLKIGIRQLIAGIRSREKRGLTRHEIQEIYAEYVKPVQSLIDALIEVSCQWVNTSDKWLWEQDFSKLRKVWRGRNDELQMRWHVLRNEIQNPDDRLELRLDDLSVNLIDWLDNEYKIVPGPWKEPIVEVKTVGDESCELELHYYVENIRLEMDGRPQRIKSELNQMIREEFIHAGIWSGPVDNLLINKEIDTVMS